MFVPRLKQVKAIGEQVYCRVVNPSRKKKRLLGGQFTVVVGEMVIATDVLGATTRVPVQVTNPLR